MMDYSLISNLDHISAGRGIYFPFPFLFSDRKQTQQEI